jgi:serine/threonine protein phosphatase PrpC
VGGVLAVSRAFGDKLLKQYVVADPEIKEEVVDSSLEFLILASDGLWDVVTNEVPEILLKYFRLDFGYSALGLPIICDVFPRKLLPW